MNYGRVFNSFQELYNAEGESLNDYGVDENKWKRPASMFGLSAMLPKGKLPPRMAKFCDEHPADCWLATLQQRDKFIRGGMAIYKGKIADVYEAHEGVRISPAEIDDAFGRFYDSWREELGEMFDASTKEMMGEERYNRCRDAVENPTEPGRIPFRQM